MGVKRSRSRTGEVIYTLPWGGRSGYVVNDAMRDSNNGDQLSVDADEQ